MVDETPCFFNDNFEVLQHPEDELMQEYKQSPQMPEEPVPEQQQQTQIEQPQTQQIEVEQVFESEFVSKLSDILQYVTEPSSIHTVILDNTIDLLAKGGELSRCDKLYIEQFQGCIRLSLRGIGMKSLKNMPNLPKLQELRLSDNILTGEDLHYLNQYSKLSYLDISNNQIRLFEHMLQLKVKLTSLKHLCLSANPIQEEPYYRENLYEKLPQVNVLDGFDKNDEIVEFKSLIDSVTDQHVLIDL